MNQFIKENLSVVYAVLIIIVCIFFGITNWPPSDVDKPTASTSVGPVEEEYRGFLHVDHDRQTGFLNTESVMASFYRIDYTVDGDPRELYKIEISRCGFERSLFHEVGTFQGAVEFLEKLQGL